MLTPMLGLVGGLLAVLYACLSYGDSSLLGAAPPFVRRKGDLRRLVGGVVIGLALMMGMAGYLLKTDLGLFRILLGATGLTLLLKPDLGHFRILLGATGRTVLKAGLGLLKAGLGLLKAGLGLFRILLGVTGRTVLTGRTLLLKAGLGLFRILLGVTGRTVLTGRTLLLKAGLGLFRILLGLTAPPLPSTHNLRGAPPEALMSGGVTNSRSPARRLPIEYALVLTGLVGVFCLLFGATFLADFGVIEEYRLVSDSQETLRHWLTTMVDEDILAFGRVRPVYFFFHFGKILLLGASPHALHLATTGLGVLTCFLFYVAARRVGADIRSALVFILLFAVTGDQSTIWYQIFSPAETFGMFLTAVAVWALVRAAARAEPSPWNAVALVAMALAGLAKESFILIIPALLLLRWVLECWLGHNSWRPALRKLRRFLLAGAAVFAIELLAVAVVMLSRPASFGATAAGLSRASFDPRTWYALLVSPGLASLSVYGAAGAILLLLYGCWPNHRRARPYLLAVAVATVAWLVPQLVLYRHGISAHYLFPAIVAPAAVVGLALSVLWRRPHWITRTAWVAAVVSLFPLFSHGIAVETERASRYTADTRVVGEIVTYSRENVAPGHAIIIAADPFTPYGSEALFALSTYLKVAGSPSPIYLWPVLDPPRRTSLQMAAAWEAEAFGYPKTLGARDVGAVIVLTGPTGIGTVPAWFADAQWRELVFRKPYYALTLDTLRYVRLGYVTHRVLVHGEEAQGMPSDSPLVMVDPSLQGRVGINPLLQTPAWGLGQDSSGSVLWLGDGENSTMSSMLWSAERQTVQVACEVVAGPGRADGRRTMELTFSGGSATTTTRETFDGAGVLTFSGTLQPGRNELRLVVLDTASADRRPDEPSLLVLLHRMTVSAPPSPLRNGVASGELDRKRPRRQPGH